MFKMYRNIGDLYNEVLSCLVIDLVPHAAGIEPYLLEALIDPPAGLYVPGSIEPLFEFKLSYDLIDHKHKATGHVVNFVDILNDLTGNVPLPPGDFNNEEVGITIKRVIYERIKKNITTHPTLPVKGCELVVSVILEYINNLCPYTSVITNRYNLQDLIKPEFFYLFETKAFENGFENLINELKRFIGRDDTHHYFYQINGSTFILEKGLDFRVMEWHKERIQKSEGYDHDFGGIQEGYEINDYNRPR